MKKNKPILLIIFDIALNSYTSGWKGVRNIPDPPVPGALEFLVKAVKHFDVQIYSRGIGQFDRSTRFGGRWAMKRWLKRHYYKLGLSLSGADKETFNNPFWKFIAETAFADPWECEVKWATKRLLKMIKFPKERPKAFLTINGYFVSRRGFPDPEELLKLKGA